MRLLLVTVLFITLSFTQSFIISRQNFCQSSRLQDSPSGASFLAEGHVFHSMILSHAAHVDPMLPIPVGSSLIMLTIVSLLYAWEKSVEWIREEVPSEIMPMVDSILAEIGGLGFIGLVLQTISGTGREALEEASTKLFGDGELLMESFEFLHSAFFQVGIGFFLAVGAMVVVGLQKLAEIESIQDLQVSDGVCTVTPEKLAKYLPLDECEFTKESSCLVDIWQEIVMPTDQRAARVLLMRYRLTEQYSLPSSFRVEEYVQNAFARNLLELVELSPLTWIYLIPALALANSVDLSHDVVNSASPNALDTAGYFFSTPTAFLPNLFVTLLSCLWGIFNCWKLTQIKYFVMPRLTQDENGTIQISSPLMETTTKFESPSWVKPIESIWAKPAKTKYERLFGTAGAAGPDLYRSSVKFQTWLCITNIVFFAGQVLPRDIEALINHAPVGDPSSLTAEFIAYSGFVLLSMFQLIFVAPRAFWNFCLVDCMEDRVSQIQLKTACSVPEEKTLTR